MLVYITDSQMGGGMVESTAEQVLAAQRVQLAFFGLAGVLMLAGTIVPWRARSTRVALGAVLLLTLPALFLPAFGPAFLPILQS